MKALTKLILTSGVLLSMLSVGCGRDPAQDKAVNECTLTLHYASNATTGSFTNLTFSTPTDTCEAFLRDQSGRSYLKLEVKGSKTSGYFTSVAFEASRTVNFAANEHPISNDTSFERYFDKTDNSLISWVLPWSDVPATVTAIVTFPSPITAADYPSEIDATVAKDLTNP